MSLAPDDALAYLRLLSTDVRAAAVLHADRGVQAGDPRLAVATGGVLRASKGPWTVVVQTGPHVLEALLRADVDAALDALEP